MAHQGSPCFGNLVREARLTAGLTQEELAERSGLSVRGISDLERGLVRSPRRDTLALLAEALALSDAERQHWTELRQRLSLLSNRPRSNDDCDVQPATHLPHPLTSFIGRQREQVDLTRILSHPEVRLVTITGPGGVGKTRLAIAVARQLLHEYSDHVRFIDLVPVQDPEDVLPAIAAALGVRDTGTQSLRGALAAQLRGATQLLVLDNMEHVAPSASDVTDLLNFCPELTVLATSRSSLRVQGEREYPLSPLAMPEQGVNVELETLAEVESVALFVERARLVKPDFRITADNVPSVVAICQRLDGLPLAIELAAAWIRLLPPESLLQRLERRLPLLVSKALDIPERHRTLRATIQWSYDLLPREEQRLYRALSVFHGGWTLEAAESIVDSNEFDVMSALEGLIEQSFVRVHAQVNETVRYRMLETIREFGSEQLQATEEAEAVQYRHARYILALLEQAESHFRSAEEANWMVQLEAEHANIRAALQWARARAAQHDPQSLIWSLRLAGAAWWFWYVRGHLREAREQLDAVVHLFRVHQEKSQEMSDSADVALAYARCLFGQGCFAFWMADLEQFDPPMKECRSIYQWYCDRRGLAMWSLFVGYGLQHNGDFDEAEPLLEEAIESSRELDDMGSVAIGLLGLGEIRLRQQRYAEAADFISESLTLSEGINDTRGIAAARAALGAVRLGQYECEAARTLLTESLETRVAIEDKGGIAWCLERLAQLALVGTQSSTASPVRAARLFGAAKALRDAIGAPIDVVDQPANEHLIHEVQARLSESAFIAAWEAGRALPLGSVIEYALSTDVAEGNPASVVIDHHGLTPREVEVLRLMVEGMSDREIADMLYISRHTIMRHVSSILTKLGVRSRTTAATRATRDGIV
jgi:predicted ATPase/DNA-binding CsgD family transcriptional regulator/DNA-binding XRE family transcriptional regulator